jgi:hypothetical protein
VSVDGLTAQEVTDFLLDPSDDSYQAWWPGTHHAFHVLRHATGEGHVGDMVRMDEHVGSRRLRTDAEVVQAVPGEKIVWLVRRWRIRLPIRVSLVLQNQENGVLLRHAITVGWSGRGGVFDPLWRLYFSDSFAAAMDQHAHTEFGLLRDLLHPAR